MMIPVTIVVTTFNDQQFLEKSLPSCLQQHAAEVIVVDDGSNLMVPEAVWKLIRDNGVEYVRHGENRGLAWARNTGFRMATSDWVVPLDADDVFQPGGVLALFDGRESDQPFDECDVVVGNLYENGKVCPPQMKGKAALTRDDWRKDNQCFATSLIRREMWRRCGGYPAGPKLQYEDWKFYARCWKAGARFRHIDIAVYTHTIRPDGMLRVMHPRGAEYRAAAIEEL